MPDEENVEILRRFLADKYSFAAADTSLLSKFKEVKVARNDLLLACGEVCHNAYFICTGCLRTYFIDEKGEEKTRYIAFENHFVSAVLPTPEGRQARSLILRAITRG